MCCVLNRVLTRTLPGAICLYLSAAFIAPALSIAQQPPVPTNDIQQINQAQVITAPDGQIHLDVVVTNPSGHAVLGLKASDFTLLDNGKPTPIVSFTAYQGALRPDPRVTITLVLDTLHTSAGAANLEQFEDEQVEKFLRQNDGYLAQPTTVLELSDHGFWQVGNSAMNGLALADAIAHHDRTTQIAEPDRSPELAALKALGLIATVERQNPGRKLLFWIGPGWGIASGRNVNTDLLKKSNRQAFFDMTVWFSTLLRLSRISLYSFSFGENGQAASDAPPEPTAMLNSPREPASPEDFTPFHLNRKMLAVESGGRVIPPSADLVTEINNALRERNAFYTLAFNPAPAAHTDEYHDVKIVPHAGRLIARASPGYYDEPYFTDLPDPALRSVTVAELEQLLDGARSSPDGDLARQLEGLRLAERFNPEKFAALSAQLHGKKSREALEALADHSAFLDPPPAEILADPPPDASAQQRIFTAASDYLGQAIHRLPDFFATRSSLDYSEDPIFKPAEHSVTFGPLHEARRTHATVLYRNGEEVVDAKARDRKGDPYALSTYGIFGPILSVVKGALSSPASLSWLRWEKGVTGPAAVFRYAVPPAQSLYRTFSCCLPDGDGQSSYAIVPGYHGVVAIDPASGAILRFTLQADLDKFVPADSSDVSVTYGPVEIAGRTYMLPRQSVSLLRRRTVQAFTEWDEGFRDWGPYMSTLNVFDFSDYHNFHADMRILSGFTPATGDADTAAPPH